MSTPQYYCFRADGAKVPLPDISAIDEIKKDALTCYTEKYGFELPANDKFTLPIYAVNKTLPLPIMTVCTLRNKNTSSEVPFNMVSVNIVKSCILDAGGGVPGNREVRLKIENFSSFAVNMELAIMWLVRQNGDPFPVGNAWIE